MCSYIACSYGYILVCVDDQFSKTFKTYLGKDAVYNFISSMIKESKYCSEVMEKHFNKELAMNKEGSEDFKNSTKCCICDNDYVDNDVKLRDYYHMVRKHRRSTHSGCHINLKQNQTTKFLSYFTT